MHVVAPAPQGYSDLLELTVEQELERSVEARTYRQIRELQVICYGKQVRVHGLSNTYYLKQLATQAIRALAPDADVDNLIAVSRA